MRGTHPVSSVGLYASPGLRCSGIPRHTVHLIVFFLLVVVMVDGLSSSGVQVNTKFGVVQGKLTKSARGRLVANFLGIPYAYPPLGELRFRNAVPWNLTWYTPYYALSDGPMCIQKDTGGNIVGSEDCLYLNVFVPLISEKGDTSNKLPVMIFVHGGAFTSGSSDSSLYAPDYLMDQNLILVTLNYRLNAFGFFSTANAASPGNYGIKDILAALRWVHENIADFDGDPDSVTMCGNSAGAAAVHWLALTNKTEGLFHRYILHSGTAFASWARQPRNTIRRASLEMARLLGCRLERNNENRTAVPVTDNTEQSQHSKDDTDTLVRESYNEIGEDGQTELDEEEMMNCMRIVPAKKIMLINDYYYIWRKNPVCTFGPTIEEDSEDAIITVHPMAAIKNRLFRDIPWIAGVVEDEGLLKAIGFYTELEAEDEMVDNFQLYLPYLLEHQALISNFTEFANAVEDFYYAGNVTGKLRQNITELVGDALITWPTYRAVKYQSEMMNSSTYFYLFSYEGTFTKTFSTGIPIHYGIAHTDELNYLFPILNNMFRDQLLHNTEDDTTIINIMTEMWANFVRTGVPRAWMTPKWPNFGETHEYLRFGSGRSPDIFVESDFLPERMAFWEDLTANFSEDTMQHLVLLGNPPPEEDEKNLAIPIYTNQSLIYLLILIVTYIV